MTLPYTIRLKPDPDDGWVAEIEELPGCIAAGDTQAEGLEILEGAKELWLTVSLENGDDIPEPEKSLIL
ncbi:MAG: type II toxin-antitoxin system HicB family antitoxin [Aggregatilineales bacterium]